MRDDLRGARAKRGGGRRHQSWFSVTLLFRSVVGDSPSLRPLCEERVVLFRVDTEGEARSAAISYARDAEHSYKKLHAEGVLWRFVRIERIEGLEGPKTNIGWEIAGRFVRRSIRTLEERAGEHTARADGCVFPGIKMPVGLSPANRRYWAVW
jgi:hypothetical protein